MKYFYTLFTLLSISAYGQIIYEPGYIITEGNVRTEALIKNDDWEKSPESITYKVSEDGQSQKITINEMREFGIGDEVRYVRAEVQIDQSSENLNSLSYDRNPIFEKQTVMLRQLVKGSANLYSYVTANRKRYFFNKADGPIQQLIYKEYYKDGDGNSGHRRYNNFYRSQIYQEVNCGNVQAASFDKIDYTQKDLVKQFQLHNSCSGDVQDNVLTEAVLKRKPFFRFNAVAGLTSASVELTAADNNAKSTLDFGNKLIFTAGAEIEYVLAFNKSKWSLFFNPLYSKYTGSDDYVYSKLSQENVETLDFEATFIDLPAGIRYHMYLNTDSRIFINAAYVRSIVKVEPVVSPDSGNINLDNYSSSQQSIAFGLGYSFKKLSAEVRFSSGLDLDRYIFRETMLQRTVLLLKYQVF